MDGSIKALAALGIALLYFSTPALGDDRASAWFTPALTVEAAPTCASILQAERNRFFAPDSEAYAQLGFKKIREMYAVAVPDPDVEKVGDGDLQLIVTPRGQRPVFTYFRKQAGCGGACDTEQVRVADTVISRPPTRQNTPTASKLAAGWTLYKTNDGDFYVLGIPDERLQAYRISSPARIELQCEVQLRPEKIHESSDPALQRAWRTNEALVQARAAIARTGHCGSSRTDTRWHTNVRDALEQALYRPWAVVSRKRSSPSENSWGDYGRIASHLSMWSLSGIREYRAFNRYLQQMNETSVTLAGFYQEKFGWPATRSTEVATQAVREALSLGFGFYLYDPFPRERQLRQAILERQPIATIKALDVEVDSGDRVFESYDPRDSILNVAVEYPEALQYLLQNGVNPNVGNAFGKTPLMYAAQYNQLEAARMLLAAGANPNAATFVPDDTCSYALTTTGMTPLHYATRYASAAMIRLLVEHEATISSAARRGNDPEFGDAEYPLDWLKQYAGDAAEAERNPNLTAAELPALIKLLRVPTVAEQQLVAAKLVTRAQADYARGEFELAYRRLQTALSAQPDNDKAIADLPLVALRAGHLDAAIEAANRAIGGLSDPALQAAAWFNKGLACEQQASMPNAPGNKACDTDWMRPFATAWKLHPTPARANQLKQLFNKDGVGVCKSPSGLVDKKVWSLQSDLAYGGMQRVYVLHRALEPMDLQSAGSVVRAARVKGISATPRVVDRFILDDEVLTVLESNLHSLSPEIDVDPCLMPMIDALTLKK